MIDPVDRGAVIDELRACAIEAATLYGINDALKTAFKESLRGINDLPNVEAERKRGRWIYGEDEYGIDGYHCDKCGFFVPWDYTHTFINYITDYNFCPSCGAEMSEGGKDALN